MVGSGRNAINMAFRGVGSRGPALPLFLSLTFPEGGFTLLWDCATVARARNDDA